MNKKTISILLALLLCLYAVMAIGSTDDDGATKDTAAPKSTQAVNTTTEKESETETEEIQTTAEAAADGKLRIYPGETLNSGDFKITFVSVEDYTDYESYVAPESGNKIIKLDFKCQNDGTADEYISYYSFECYADNETAEVYIFGEDNLSATVSSGRSTSGSVYFEVPADAESIEVEYEIDIWTSEKAIFVVK